MSLEPEERIFKDFVFEGIPEYTYLPSFGTEGNGQPQPVQPNAFGMWREEEEKNDIRA
jgi:hypothetical protein